MVTDNILDLIGNTPMVQLRECCIFAKAGVLSPGGMSEERKKLITALGAELILTPDKDGIAGAVERVRQMAAEDARIFVPQQFENPNNPRGHYEGPAHEHWRQM